MQTMTYQPGESLIHRLHPLTKVAWLLSLTAAVFLATTPVIPLATVVVASTLLALSGAKPWQVSGRRLWLPLAIAILVAHALAVKSGERLIGPVTDEGLISGIRAMGRLLGVILLSGLFVLTTDPVALSRTLMRGGLPYRWGFALVTALRLAPIFRVEAHQIYRAQLIRGVAYDATWPRRLWLLLRHFSLPLLVSALRTAHSLSLSMEGRGFGLHRCRTYAREVHPTRADAIATLLLLGLIATAILVRVIT